MIQLTELDQIVDGILDINAPSYLHTTSISIDSRNYSNNSKSLFICFVTDTNNGHQFISDAYEKGVRNFIISEDIETVNDINTFKVENTVIALQKIAAHYRKKFTFPLVGISGSYGKTIVKEWLFQLLSSNLHIGKSPKSYNSKIGVPISLLELDNDLDFALIEMGISHPNEMKELSNLVKAEEVILTNIGGAHQKNFKNISEKAKEKLQAIQYANTAFVHESYTPYLNNNDKNKSITFGPSTENDIQWKLGKNYIEIIINGTSNTYSTNFTSRADIENIAICLSYILYKKIDITNLDSKIMDLPQLSMRMEVMKGENENLLINDVYTADFQNLKHALEILFQQEKSDNYVIVSDFDTPLTKSDWEEILINYPIKKWITIGTEPAVKLSNHIHYSTADEAIVAINKMGITNSGILIKGARKYNLEHIVEHLVQQNHTTVLEINMNALKHNLDYFKQQLEPTTLLMVMIKAFAYGSGAIEIGRFLEKQNVDYFAVAYTDEGVELRKAGIRTPIMVMNPEENGFNQIIQYRLEPEIYSFSLLYAFLKTLKKSAISFPYPIHIKLDTGMKRLGFEKENLQDLKKILEANKAYLNVQSIFSHLAASDVSQENEFTEKQVTLFQKMYLQLTQNVAKKPLAHILNTSGIVNFKQHQMDMVRLGIGLYGSGAPNYQNELLTVGRLTSKISQLKSIQKGESVGYSRSFIADSPMKIATIPIGYADGIPRLLGNKNGQILVGNTLCNIVGNVCMDMLMIDVTDANCNEGDTVVIFGTRPTIEDLANKSKTISYEILTSISTRVKRQYVY